MYALFMCMQLIRMRIRIPPFWTIIFLHFCDHTICILYENTWNTDYIYSCSIAYTHIKENALFYFNFLHALSEKAERKKNT